MTSSRGRVASPDPDAQQVLVDLVDILTDGGQLIARLEEDPSDPEVVDQALAALRALHRAKDLPQITRDQIITALADNVRELNMTAIGRAAGLTDAMVSRIAAAGGARPRTYRQPRRPADT